jgi:hypothetical protein
LIQKEKILKKQTPQYFFAFLMEIEQNDDIFCPAASLIKNRSGVQQKLAKINGLIKTGRLGLTNED